VATDQGKAALARELGPTPIATRKTAAPVMERPWPVCFVLAVPATVPVLEAVAFL